MVTPNPNSVDLTEFILNNWTSDVEVSMAYNTDIVKSVEGTETRRSLTDIPDRTLSMKLTGMDLEQSEKIQALLLKHMTSQISIPMFHDIRKFPVEGHVPAGEEAGTLSEGKYRTGILIPPSITKVVKGSRDYLEWQDLYEGCKVALFNLTNSKVTDLLYVTYNGTVAGTGASLGLSHVLTDVEVPTGTYDSESWAVVMMDCQISLDTSSFKQYTAEHTDVSLKVTQLSGSSALGPYSQASSASEKGMNLHTFQSGTTSLLSPFNHNWSSLPTVKVFTDSDVTKLGLSEAVHLNQDTVYRQFRVDRLFTKEEYQEHERLFHHLKGRRGSFFLMSPENKFSKPTAFYTNKILTTISDPVLFNKQYNFVGIELSDGSCKMFTVDQFLPDGITVFEDIAVTDFDYLVRLSSVHKVRKDSDEMSVKWVNSQSCLITESYTEIDYFIEKVGFTDPELVAPVAREFGHFPMYWHNILDGTQGVYKPFWANTINTLGERLVNLQGLPTEPWTETQIAPTLTARMNSADATFSCWMYGNSGVSDSSGEYDFSYNYVTPDLGGGAVGRLLYANTKHLYYINGSPAGSLSSFIDFGIYYNPSEYVKGFCIRLEGSFDNMNMFDEPIKYIPLPELKPGLWQMFTLVFSTEELALEIWIDTKKVASISLESSAKLDPLALANFAYLGGTSNINTSEYTTSFLCQGTGFTNPALRPEDVGKDLPPLAQADIDAGYTNDHLKVPSGGSTVILNTVWNKALKEKQIVSLFNGRIPKEHSAYTADERRDLKTAIPIAKENSLNIDVLEPFTTTGNMRYVMRLSEQRAGLPFSDFKSFMNLRTQK